ncbi:MAG: accessory gene regulator B family protein [Lachnospiraceae bacterium]|nr:accessory gene regulator B family protein [Lachnospiraceae bacterium]
MKIFNMWDGVNQYFVSTLIHILEINKDENQKRYEIVKYVLSYIVNEIGKIMILTLIFLLQGKLFEFVIAFLTIVSLRIFIGGSHRETMLGCFLQSFLTFEAIMLLDKSIIISMPFNYIIYIFILVWIWKKAPLLSGKRARYNELQCMRFKTMAITMLLLLVMAVGIMPDSVANIMLWAMLFQLAELSVTTIQMRKEETRNGFKEKHC